MAPSKVEKQLQAPHTKAAGKRGSDSGDELLVDNTVSLQPHSKKIARKQIRREQKAASKSSETTHLLEFPLEVLQYICSFLLPNDFRPLRMVSRAFRNFVDTNESTLANLIIQRRYSILSKCFPLPVLLADVDPVAQSALLDGRRKQMLTIHRQPFEHIPNSDETRLCTCMACLYAWYNLCLIIDLARWQRGLAEHRPLPIFRRGYQPERNQDLLNETSGLVLGAIKSPLRYAAILHIHLISIIRAILRPGRKDKQLPKLEARSYRLTEIEAQRQIDDFLSRMGPPSYEFPCYRDDYYTLDPFVPNRRWDKAGFWLYHAHEQHERDLKWVVDRFTSPTS